MSNHKAISVYRSTEELKCVVCRKYQYEMNNWRYSRIDNTYFCSLPCYNLYSINPLAYEDGPRTAHHLKWENPKFNIDI